MNADGVKMLLTATSVLLSIGAFLFSMNRLNEEGAVQLENRITALEGKVKGNEERLENIGDDTKQILRILKGRSTFMKEAGDVSDYLCEKDPACSRRFPPLGMPD